MCVCVAARETRNGWRDLWSPSMALLGTIMYENKCIFYEDCGLAVNGCQ